MSEKSAPDPDIEISTRGIGGISPGNQGAVSCHSIRGKYGPKDRFGEITTVKTLDNGRICIQFYDDERDRDIEVVVGTTLGESKVRSRKEKRWTTLGSPLRVSVFAEADSQEEARHTAIHEHYEGRHESVVAAANVKWNSNILKWFQWSSRNA